jgi:DNA mismatch endonuclease, patch repair protein
MADTRTSEKRRKIMQSVGVKNTGPELTLRRLLHVLGFRYRLHSKNLPGKPDLVFPKRKKVIFVHGCFWHSHGCKKGQAPKSRLNYWEPKLAANRERDKRNREQLHDLGWSVLTIWACEKPSDVLQRPYATSPRCRA